MASKRLPQLPVTKYSDAAAIVASWVEELDLRGAVQAAKAIRNQEVVLCGSVVAPLFQLSHFRPYTRGMVADAAYYEARAHQYQMDARECERQSWDITRQMREGLEACFEDSDREAMKERSSAAYRSASRASVRRANKRPVKV